MAAVRAALGNVAGDQFALLPFVLSVMVSAWYGGLVLGLLATGLGAVVGVSFFYPPVGTWAASEWVRLAIFLAEGSVMSGLCAALRAARGRAEAHAADARHKQRQLEAKDRYKNEFLATLAHEIRNPPTQMLGNGGRVGAVGLNASAGPHIRGRGRPPR